MEYVSSSLNDDDVLEDYDDLDEAVRRRSDRRSFFSQTVRPPPLSGGVQTANLRTPSGSATVQLPTAVPTKDDLERTSRALEDAINRASRGVTSNQADVDSLGAAVMSLRAGQRKLKKTIASQNMMNLVLSMMGQQQAQKSFNEHTHNFSIDVAALEGKEGPATISTSTPNSLGTSSSLTTLLPLLLMGGMGGGSDSEGAFGGGMSSMLLVLALTGAFK